MKTPVNTIVFDFDGTLVDSGRAVKQAFQETLAEMDDTLSDHINGKRLDSLSCHTIPEMLHAAGVEEPNRIENAVHIYNRKYMKISPVRSTLFPGIPDLLRHFRNQDLTLAVATNERRENIDLLLPAFGIDSFFEATVCENEVARSKPDPEMLNTVMDAVDADPFETLMVGDSLLDIQMGKNAGCRTCAAGYGTHSAEELVSAAPDYRIDRPKDLIDIAAAYFFKRM